MEMLFFIPFVPNVKSDKYKTENKHYRTPRCFCLETHLHSFYYHLPAIFLTLFALSSPSLNHTSVNSQRIGYCLSSMNFGITKGIDQNRRGMLNAWGRFNFFASLTRALLWKVQKILDGRSRGNRLHIEERWRLGDNNY